MQLRHLKEDPCSTCGASVRSEEIASTHVNGEQFENRRFRCGKEIRWIPNFSRVEIHSDCPMSTRGGAILKMRDEVTATLLASIANDTRLSKMQMDSFKDGITSLVRSIVK